LAFDSVLLHATLLNATTAASAAKNHARAARGPKMEKGQPFPAALFSRPD
jgi:hypothetical protein